jgi:hypothetical protein
MAIETIPNTGANPKFVAAWIKAEVRKGRLGRYYFPCERETV